MMYMIVFIQFSPMYRLCNATSAECKHNWLWIQHPTQFNRYIPHSHIFYAGQIVRKKWNMDSLKKKTFSWTIDSKLNYWLNIYAIKNPSKQPKLCQTFSYNFHASIYSMQWCVNKNMNRIYENKKKKAEKMNSTFRGEKTARTA